MRTFNIDIHNVDPMEGSSLSVRKGAWTEEEDILLKKCIENYGEGTWHKVPSRAGLNRCRKSCRLRWLNYLKPNINRGAFGADEVDLIIRLHNLLGNRWSLIAGRLPGRTANDVKNYWNTHLQKKFNPPKKDFKPKPDLNPLNPNIKVIKPRPQTLSKNSFPIGLDGNNKNSSTNNNNHYAAATPSSSLILPNSCNNSNYCIPGENDEIMWWEDLLMNDKVDDDQQRGSLNDINQSGLGHQSINEDLGEKRSLVVEEGNCGSWDELFNDVELWDVFNP